jgi:DHA1 family bicyclomycin/chloramphenicol resistance-like MFS transporter
VASTHQESPQRQFLRYTILIGGVTALAPVAIDMYLPALPALSSDLHATPQLANATMSVFLAGVAAGQMVFGPWSDRIGRRPLVLAGLAGYLLGAALASSTGSITLFLLARLIQALGGCSALVAGRAVVRDVFDHKQSAHFFSMITMISGAAPILAPLLGSAVLLAAGWRAIFGIMALFALALLVASMVWLPESRSAEAEAHARSEHPLRSYLALLRNRRLVGYLAIGACNSAGFFTYLASASVVLPKVFSIAPPQFSLLFAVNAAGLVSAGPFNRLLLRRWSSDRILRNWSVVTLLLGALFLVLPGRNAGGLVTLLVLCFVTVSGTTIVMVNSMAGALSSDRLRSGGTSALYGFTTFGAGTLASFIAGLLFDGTPRGMAVVMACALIGVFLGVRRLVPHAAPVEI